VLPAAFVALVIAVVAVLADEVSTPLLVVVGALAALAAAALFSGIVFQLIERNEEDLVERNDQLDAVQSAAMSIAGEFELQHLLERFVERSREIVGAAYGAMSVLAPDGQIAQFITSGISAEDRARIGDPPVGRGLLGVIMSEGKALRLADMSQHPQSVGFPPHHPPMTSLLGVPVVSRGRTIGNLYLTDKIEKQAFTEADEEMVRTFAAHAAIAIETSRLLDEGRLLAVLRERERIGMDLHDGTIQSIYAVSLGLESAIEDAGASPDAVAAMNAAIEQLNDVIRDVRSYIFELRPAKLSYDLSESLVSMIDEFRDNSQVAVHVDIAPALPPLDEDQRAAVFHITREALVNARKHAQASKVAVALRARAGSLALSIEDDGQGFDPSAAVADHHEGTRNMATRARVVGGNFSIKSAPGSGTRIEVELPLNGGGLDQ
jgi:signal transduction histidine kinase